LKQTYAYLCDCNVTDTQMTKTIKIYKNIISHGQYFGSTRYPQSQHPAYIMATWTDSSGFINEALEKRPGKVLYYIECCFKYSMQGEFRKHIFVKVVWYADHPNKLHYVRPLELWKREFICDGPAFLLPIYKISSRCVACKGRFRR